MTEEPVTGKAAAEETAAASGAGKALGTGEATGAASAAVESAEAATAEGKPAAVRRRGNRRAVSAGPSGLLPVTAKEDDARAWGDRPDDNDAWLREQRPPHWG